MSVNYYVAQNQNLIIKAKSFTIQNGTLYRLGQDNKFNLGSFEILIILQEFHTRIAKGHFSINIIYKRCKILVVNSISK